MNAEFIRLMHGAFTPSDEANLKLLIDRSGVTVQDVHDNARHSVRAARWDEWVEDDYPLPPVWPYDIQEG